MTLPFMDPGEDFSTARKQFHTEIGQAGVPAYNDEYEASSRRFLQTLAAELEGKDLTKVIDECVSFLLRGGCLPVGK